jgi:hypothetical protein
VKSFKHHTGVAQGRTWVKVSAPLFNDPCDLGNISFPSSVSYLSNEEKTLLKDTNSLYTFVPLSSDCEVIFFHGFKRASAALSISQLHN